MSDAVDRLFAAFVAEHNTGGPADPVKFLARAESAVDKSELEALLDGFLARAPRRRWDPAAFSGSSAERLADGLDRALVGRGGRWPIELPRLRERAQIRRSELVTRLAAALGVGAQREKVASYYHQMEQGLLPAEGVSQRVLDALATIVGSSGDALRAAGAAVSPPIEPPPAGGAPAFARMARIDEQFDTAAPAPVSEPAAAGPEWDAVDELFRGG